MCQHHRLLAQSELPQPAYAKVRSGGSALQAPSCPDPPPRSAGYLVATNHMAFTPKPPVYVLLVDCCPGKPSNLGEPRKPDTVLQWTAVCDILGGQPFVRQPCFSPPYFSPPKLNSNLLISGAS